MSKSLRHDLVYHGIIERLFLKNSSVLHCSSGNWKKGALVRVATTRWRTLRNISYQRQLFPVSHSQSQFNKWKQSHDQEELQKLNNFVTKGRGTAQQRQSDSSCTFRILIPAHHSHCLRTPTDPFSSHTIQRDQTHSRGCLRSPTLEPVLILSMGITILYHKQTQWITGLTAIPLTAMEITPWITSESMQSIQPSPGSCRLIANPQTRHPTHPETGDLHHKN